MAKPYDYDAATKDLIETDPASLLRYLGLSVTGPVVIQNSDLTTVVAESDRIFLVEEDPPWLVHLEIQTSAETDLDLRMDRYNLMIEYRERMPVVSSVLLLRPEAHSPKLTGIRVRKTKHGEIYREFHYHVVRAWKQSAESILQGPPALLPLTTLADIPNDQICNMVGRIEAKLSELSDPNMAKRLRTNAQILMGLRFSEEEIESCPWRTDKMRESTIYQKILREGRADEANRLLHREGTRKFGEPTAEIMNLVNSVRDIEQLEQLIDRIHDVSNWNELFRK